MKVTGLMVVYSGDDPDLLAETLESIGRQTVALDCLLLVENGLLSERHIEVISCASNSFPISLLRLPGNKGLAEALNCGLGAIEDGLVARFDPDDRVAEDRIETQLAAIKQHKVDVICALQVDVDRDLNWLRRKVTPEVHKEIVSRLRFHNCICHSSLLVKREVYEKYRTDVGKLEDYFWHFDMLRQGAQYYCVQRPSVYVLADEQQNLRRGGFHAVGTDLRLRLEMLRSGFIGPITFVLTSVGYFLLRTVPPGARSVFYKATRRSV